MAIKTKNIQKSISIPDRYNSSERARIGDMIVKQIKKRTANGVSANGTAFKYVKKSPHKGDNLKDSGDMMALLGVVSDSTGSVTVGYSNDGSLESAQVEGNQIGSYGGAPNSAVAKPFIGVSNDELDLILSKFDSNNRSSGGDATGGTDTGTVSEEGLTESFINSVLARQGLS